MKLIVLIFSFLLTAAVCASENPLDEFHISLAAAKTIPIALKKFHRDQPRADDKHFDVYIRETETSVEIEFLPHPSPNRDVCGKDGCTIFLDAGGATVYGFAIVYTIDKRSRKITKIGRPS